MLNRGKRRCPSAAVVSGNDEVIGLRLGYTGCDRANTNFGNQLHANTRFAIRILQVVNQLGDIFY